MCLRTRVCLSVTMHTLTQETAHGVREGAETRLQNDDSKTQETEAGAGGGGVAKEEGVRRAKAAARVRGEVRASLSPVRHMQNPWDRDTVLDRPRGRREEGGGALEKTWEGEEAG